MGDRAAACREQSDVLLVDPDRMDDQLALIQQAEVVDVPDKRLAVFLLAEHPLQPRLQDVNDEGHIMLGGQALSVPQNREW